MNLVALKRGIILIAIVIAAIAFSAYQIVAHPINLEKANTEIVSESAVSQQISEESIDSFSNIFENALENCKSVRAPQKSFVQVTNPTAMMLASSLTKESKTDLEKAKALFSYASNEIEYNRYDNWRTTAEVLETKDGDCTDKSIVLVSTLKNAGIESYVVYGNEINDYSHAWVSAKIDGKWMQLDPTAHDFNYVYNCLADESCEYKDYYLPIAGIFDENMVLKCNN